MHHLLKSISYIFHPLLMPLYGVCFYFTISPRFIPSVLMNTKLYSIALLSVFLPIALFYLLKNLGRVKTINLATPKERIIPLSLNCFIIFYISQRVLPIHEIAELHFFFIGILLSTLTCLILALFRFKASIHMIASSGVVLFFIALNIHFNRNNLDVIALLFIIIGAIASSRLHLKAHTNIELIIGFFVGLIPQLIMLNYWL